MIRYLLVGVRRAGMLGLALAMPVAARAGVMMTVEAPGVQYSQQANTVVETFDAPMPIGSYTAISSAIGEYTASAPGGAVVGGDAFGGSDQTQYIAVGAQSEPTTSVTLTFNALQSYFGFYFAAIDAQNAVLVYDQDDNLVQTVNETTVFPLLMNDPNYFGNPNTGQNTGEPYVFVNLFGTAGTMFSRIEFTNMGTNTGLETDSHTILGVVPEPSSLVAAGLGGLGLLLYGRKRRLARG